MCPRLELKQQRKAVKLLVLAAINSKDRTSAFGAFREAQAKGSTEKTLTNDELALLLDTFVNQHPYLEDGICSDQGIRLMNVDSHISNHIINKFVKLKKPILSVHDSYIVGTRDVEFLRDCMAEASIKIVGMNLAAEQEVPSYQDIMATRYPDRDYHLQVLDHYLINPAKNQTTGYKLRYHNYQTNKEGSE